MTIKRIIYGAPPSDTPAGGVKVIYQHSEKMNEIGFDSAIWHPNDESFQCTWFENDIKKIGFANMDPKSDFVVIPEIWASTHTVMLKNAGFKVAIYVQNCYYTHVNLNKNNENAIRDAFQMADIVLSISQDSTEYLINILNVPHEKIVLQRYSINHNLFKPKEKKKIITYMPRKMADHANRVVSALKGVLSSKSWSIEPIHNMNEQQVAESLSHSIIFLAFSEFEGLPVPPVEAALSGNYVIGYDGQGGKEYWKSPNFQKIQQGDIQDFVRKVLTRVSYIESKKIDLSEMNSGINVLSEHFSKENEVKLINSFIRKALELN